MPMPKMLRIHSDNASGEGKNQIMFKFAAWLVWKGLFNEVILTQFRVGHSHSKIDQRFSECRTVLAEAPVLEDPDSFVKALGRVKPREGRFNKAEQIHAAVNFKGFFELLGISVSGHTQTQQKTAMNQEACHVFSFIRRGNHEQRSPNVRNPFGTEEDEKDVIMFCQLYLASNELAQDVVVFAPAAFFDKMPMEPTNCSSRHSLSERQQKEFAKTAKRIEQAPWHLNQGAEYLRKLVSDDCAGGSSDWAPPKISWVLKHGTDLCSKASFPAASSFEQKTFGWATRAPAAVGVAPKMASKKSKPSPKPKPEAKQKAEPKQSRRKSEPETGKEETETKEPELPEVEDAFNNIEPSLPGESSSLRGRPVGERGEAGAPPGTLTAPPIAATSNSKRKRLGAIPMPEGVVLGCTKCYKAQNGCTRCRTKANVVLNADQSAWVYKD